MTNNKAHPPDVPQAAVDCLWRGQTIEAIKLVRNQQKIGLKDAKDLVDSYIRSQPSLQQRMEAARVEAKRRLVRGLIWFLILAAGAAYILFYRVGE